MSQIDTVGTFIGEIVDSGVSTTKNNFPQWVARFKATKKWVDDQATMQHFGITEPGYVDWSGFNEEITAFLVLFNNAEVFNEDTKLLNYEQLQVATGWDGSEFDSLGNGSLLGKTLLFRVEENEWNGKISLRVQWIDNENADATRSLKTLDTEGVKALSSKLKIGKKSVKPATKAASAPAGKPGVSGAVKSTPAGQKAVPTKTSAPKAPTKAAAPKATGSLPSETTKEDAWNYIQTIKGDNEDGVIADAFMAAMGDVFEPQNKNEDNATGADWAKVRDTVIKDMALSK